MSNPRAAACRAYNVRVKLPLLGIVLAAGLAAAGCHHAANNTTAFNGTFELDTHASRNVPEMMRGHSSVIHLTETAKTFTIAFIFDGDPLNISKFDLDAKTHPLNVGGPAMGSERAWRSRDGRTIHLRIHRPGGAGHPGTTENLAFALGPGGNTIRRTRTVVGGSEPEQVYIYRRMHFSKPRSSSPSSTAPSSTPRNGAGHAALARRRRPSKISSFA